MARAQHSELKDKVYITLKGSPLSLTIASRDSRRSPLKYFDENYRPPGSDSKDPPQPRNRALRYSSNQASPFVDEQDEHAIVEPVCFERGQLFVPKENQVLQHFLEIHPDNGVRFTEQDLGKDAQVKLQEMDLEEEAIEMAKGLSLEMVEMVARVALRLDVLNMTTPELRYDVKKYARRDPKEFLGVVNDPKLKLYGQIAGFIDEGILRPRKNNREIYFNLPNNKNKMLSVPYGADPILIISDYLQTDEGIPTLRMLQKAMGDDEPEPQITVAPVEQHDEEE